MDRRTFLQMAVGSTAATVLTTTSSGRAGAQDAPGPFRHGVASGDPWPDRLVIWTRVTPTDEALPGSGAGPDTPVEWEVARDAGFSDRIAHGTETARAASDHTVKVDVGDLPPGTEVWYRFHALGATSPVGRGKTAPAPGQPVDRLRFGLVSCSNFEGGYFSAYRHLAARDDLDAVFHLGDYLYEYAVNDVAGARAYPAGTLPSGLFNHETVTLEDYRLRYALYKSDPDLRAAHAAHPFVVTWDDHETENNYAGDTPENSVPPEEFLLRRAAAYRAYWENMPLRRPQLPEGADLKLYRRLHWGRLAQFDVLDTRQYRSNQAYGDGWQYPGPESENPSRTLTGAAQERWLLDGWRRSDAVWNVVPQQVTFSQRLDTPTPPAKVSMDSWDGYPASRERVLAGAQAAGVENLMVLTGDVHVHYGFDIKRDFSDPGSKTVGTEIVTTSVTSGGNGSEKPANWGDLTAANPHMRFYNGLRGYTTVTLGRERARADFKTVPHVTTQGAPLTTAASFVTEAGEPGLKPA